jgi:hypothetical protein
VPRDQARAAEARRIPDRAWGGGTDGGGQAADASVVTACRKYLLKKDLL